MLVATIVANNPGDPEAASMEVSETKLVNFAEKTKFDVTSDFTWPRGTSIDLVSDTLNQLSASLVLPEDISSIQNADGTWNGQTPAYKFEKGGKVYGSINDIPGISAAEAIRVSTNLAEYTSEDVSNALLAQSGGSANVPVFQLDPNQLFTLSKGFRVLIRRPLD